jgi:hypothetical protein
VGKRGRKKPKRVAEQTVQTPKIANDLEIVGNSEEEEEDRREATVQLTSFGLGSTAHKHRKRNRQFSTHKRSVRVVYKGDD